MALNRPLLAVAGGALLVILASLGGLAYLQLRTGPLAARLIREANALEHATFPRPAHVPSPTPGTFGQAVDPLMADVVRASGTLSADIRECLQVPIGKVGTDITRADCLAVLERERALMSRVLAATHATSGGLPPGLGIPSDPDHPHADRGLEALLDVVRLAALETRVLLGAGKPEAAVDTCVDALALGREMTLGAGAKGRRRASSAFNLLHLPCSAALDEAPEERRRQAAAQLVTLREGIPRLSQSLREEAISLQLVFSAHLFFDDEERRALAPLSALMVQAGPPGYWMIERHHVPLLRLEWRRAVATLDGMVAVVDLPAKERRRAFEAVAARHADFWPKFLGPSPRLWNTHLVPEFQECADLVDRQLLQLEDLIRQAEVDAPR